MNSGRLAWNYSVDAIAGLGGFVSLPFGTVRSAEVIRNVKDVLSIDVKTPSGLQFQRNISEGLQPIQEVFAAARMRSESLIGDGPTTAMFVSVEAGLTLWPAAPKNRAYWSEFKIGITSVENSVQRTVFSGHGSYLMNSGIVTVPEGTSLTVYSKFGGTITNDLGNAIEKGKDLSHVYSRTYRPGEAIPNYTLSPPRDLKLKGSPVTVDVPTSLFDLLKPGMGNCHWAACTFNSRALTGR